MDDLRDPLNTFKSVGEKHHLSTTTIIKVFDSMLHSVDRIKLPEVLGIDEIHMPMVTETLIDLELDVYIVSIQILNIIYLNITILIKEAKRNNNKVFILV